MVSGYVIVASLEQLTIECSSKLRQREENRNDVNVECGAGRGVVKEGGDPGREDFLVEARLRAWISEAEAQKEQQNEKTRKQYETLT